MNRDHWDFEYTAKILADAALNKKKYREDRAKWWEEQQAKVKEEIKANGIDIDESVGAQYHSNSTRGPQIVIRADLQGKLAECHAKIREHLAAAREYDGWHQVLSANPESRLKLKHGDWLFFFAAE